MPRIVLACDHHLKTVAPLARAMADLDVPTLLLSRDHDWEFGRVPGEAMRFVGERLEGRVPHVRLRGRVREAGALRSVGRAWRAVARFAPDVIHLQDSVVDDARLLLAAHARPRRYALTVHDAATHPGDRVRMRLKQEGWRRLVREAGLVFVYGAAVRDALAERVGPRAPVIVVPHGVDAPRSVPLPARPSLLFFGRISKYKGLDVLLDSLPRVWERVPELTLTVAGHGSGLPEHPLWEDPRVILRYEHVPEADVPGLFAAATAVVLPYVEASQSGVGSLAKSYGRPLVVTDAGGLPELVADGSGRVVRTGDPEALARGLIDVATRPEAAAAMGDAGARSAQESSGWPQVARLTLAAYERHLGR